MVTSRVKVTCPKCGEESLYEVEKLELVDTDLHVSCTCTCGCRFTDTYALVYLGGFTDDMWYDRDNLKSQR